MGSLRFEGREVPLVDGDTVASALYRAGVRTFTRSLKYHRRRGLYCGTGECPNCSITLDAVPGVRSCITPAREGMRVQREGGWPSTEHDLFHLTDRLHPLMPVGFYYKTFIRPRSSWPFVESVIRRATGVGRLPERAPASRVVAAGAPSAARGAARHVRTDTLVVGAGIAGLTAALDAAVRGERVLRCDEAPIGSRIPPGPTRRAIRALETDVRGHRNIEVLEGHAALGVFEGTVVPLASYGELVQAHPRRIVVATGATEVHPVFPGNDLPGIWLGRGAARMAGIHQVPIAARTVMVASTHEGIEHLHALTGSGVEVVAALVPASLVDEVPNDVEAIVDGAVERAEGRRAVRAVVVSEGDARRRIACDALVLSVGLVPRDALARTAAGETVEIVGDAALGGDDLELRSGGTVCLCEDVSIRDLEQARREGFRSAEILKRYTTVTMGPCQGAMCGRALACFARDGSGGTTSDHRTTARPPLRPVALETLAASVHEIVVKRTSLHDVHLATGARLDWSGGWKRPFTYGDRVEEYRAVRERVSVMDVGTLGKVLIAGREAAALVDRVFPTRLDDLEPGRARYVLVLDEAGYVADDGLLCALEDGAYYLTSTTGGADRMDARLREWADRLGLHVHLLDRTGELGAILVAGPRSRQLLERLSDDPLDAATFRYPGHREIAVADVPCRAIRSGFVGELAFELHHPRARGPELWDALLRAGEPFGIRPHGLDALELLRLEKGHLYIGHDTLPDDTPAKLGLGWAVDMRKPWFVGKAALEGVAGLPLSRRLAGFEFDQPPGEVSELRGMPLTSQDEVVGRVTSAERSIALDRAIGLGWVRAADGGFPTELRAGSAIASVVPTPFYDPEGVRLRG